jgi:hypothetical protein
LDTPRNIGKKAKHRESMLSELANTKLPDLAMLSVALRELRHLA